MSYAEEEERAQEKKPQRGVRSWDESPLPFPRLPQTPGRRTLGDTLRIGGLRIHQGQPEYFCWSKQTVNNLSKDQNNTDNRKRSCLWLPYFFLSCVQSLLCYDNFILSTCCSHLHIGFAFVELHLEAADILAQTVESPNWNRLQLCWMRLLLKSDPPPLPHRSMTLFPLFENTCKKGAVCLTPSGCHGSGSGTTCDRD
ncbi:hypothetical protein F2P81_020244 [Scophthalmus maximus]|uniref:Uncharacterized protein n=1 Tax=Scophthalmus maximus TaxID=52904 RepID=A0A6A4RZJ0_SCOMX|nr:hypothetical protein F2P81_020244 [Scophthalmus maximus]